LFHRLSAHVTPDHAIPDFIERAAAGQGRARQPGRQAMRIHLRGDQSRPVERLGGGKRPIERGRRVDVLRNCTPSLLPKAAKSQLLSTT
jgi:hypothetical protein